MERNGLSNFGRGSPKEHSFEIISKIRVLEKSFKAKVNEATFRPKYTPGTCKNLHTNAIYHGKSSTNQGKAFFVYFIHSHDKNYL